jgi:hypothetical protein
VPEIVTATPAGGRTHLAQSHEDTTDGAVHCFQVYYCLDVWMFVYYINNKYTQDSDGNIFTYTFDPHGDCVARAFDSAEGNVNKVK